MHVVRRLSIAAVVAAGLCVLPLAGAAEAIDVGPISITIDAQHPLTPPCGQLDVTSRSQGQLVSTQICLPGGDTALVCKAAAHEDVQVVSNVQEVYSVSGTGSCVDAASGRALTVSFSGSAIAGPTLCDEFWTGSPGFTPTVPVPVSETLADPVTHVSRTLHETWTMAFAGAVPFTISGDATGGGGLAGACGALTQVAWLQTA